MKVSESIWPPSTELSSTENSQNFAAKAPQSPSETLQPLQWTDLGFKFAPNLGVELHEDDSKAVFTNTPSEDANEKIVNKLVQDRVQK